MIQRGKRQGWLQLPAPSLASWALIYNVKFNRVALAQNLEHPERGLGVIVQEPVSHDQGVPLICVPRDLVLSRETVENHAKTDVHLRAVLEAAGEFATTSRGAILIFLILQATGACPDINECIGLRNPFSEYIKFLPLELLPTFWSDAERALLIGTSLAPAIDAKLKSLYREYAALRESTADIEWCQRCWWDEVDNFLSFDDWKQVDAMYRSRALEFPGIGDSMVPCIDMANHISGPQTTATYDVDHGGNAVLVLRGHKTVQRDEEVTITYGNEKGACEMIFSYGFLEESAASAKDIYLGLDIPDDDPLKRVKQAWSQCAPGIRLIEDDTAIRWESDYIWLICVNEEDGLQVTGAQTVDGDQELSIRWKSQELLDVSELKPHLQADSMWEVVQLRAVTLLQDRIGSQLQRLCSLPELDSSVYGEGTGIREGPWRLSKALRRLETEMLERCYESFNEEHVQVYFVSARANPSQKESLLQSDSVRLYLDSSDA